VAGVSSLAEYFAIPVHVSGTGGSFAQIDVTPQGNLPPGSFVSAQPARAAVTPGSAPQPDAGFERALREVGRTVYARRWAEARAERGGTAPDALQRSAMLVPTAAVGSTVTLNGSPDAACSSIDKRTARVVAVTDRAVVLADVGNPSGGFTDDEYRSFGVTFDTLVHAVDVAAFGEPTDVDHNGKVVLFFTRKVNELTPRGSNVYTGGFFHPRDVLTSKQCPASNDGEMFYLLVPDPNAEVTALSNGPITKSFVQNVTVGTLAHEYQHLINAFRRAYVNNSPADEEAWLNEGLSHVAEELVFYKASGTAPGQNLGGERFTDARFKAAFQLYQLQNIERLKRFLFDPTSVSPWSGIEVQHRGAVWAFLRYAADQRAAQVPDVWFRLVNSQSGGIVNLESVFGADVVGLERDWRVSLLTDDYAVGVDPRYTQPSWNFRTLYPKLPVNPGSYPLVVRSLQSGVATSEMLVGGASAYMRFGVGAGAEALVRGTSGGVLPRGNVQLLVVRTR
jgi:hypothetical protein